MEGDDVTALLEVQYMAIEELIDILNRMPTREEVIDRIEHIVSRPNLSLVQ